MNYTKLLLIINFLLLVGCSQDGYDDLKLYMDDIAQNGGAGRVEPVPTFSPYKPFDYSATSLRAPFNKPIVIVDPLEIKPADNVKPDENRLKEYLESFSIESLQMVGTLEQDGEFFALLTDPQGSVHYVKTGNYLGRNHGRIVKASKTNIQVVEIVATGGGWVERPRTLELRESN